MKRFLPSVLTAAAVVVSASAHEAAADMTRAAVNLLASLNDEQKAKASFAFDDAERTNWHFVPKDRKGLKLSEMAPAQDHLVYVLLGSGLSEDGFAQAATIMSLEAILAELEKDPVKRDPEKYYVSIFGTPSAEGTWGWRVEGHHCSINFTLKDGKIAGTPSFYGSNPGEVRQGPRAGLRVLGPVEDLGRELVKSLTEEQKKIAILPGAAPAEVLTEARPKVDPLEPAGLLAKDLTPEQLAKLKDVVNAYLGRSRAEVAAAEIKQIEDAGWDKVGFVWMGGLERGEPHYYRVQGPTFLIEYDNTQGQANHPHAVWRDFHGDFGLDLLGAHLKTAHAQ